MGVSHTARKSKINQAWGGGDVEKSVDEEHGVDQTETADSRNGRGSPWTQDGEPKHHCTTKTSMGQEGQDGGNGNRETERRGPVVSQ